MKQNKNKKKIATILIIVFSAALIVLCALLGYQFYEISERKKDDASLSEEVVYDIPDAQTLDAETPDLKAHLSNESIDYLKRRIDFDKLKSINPDVFCWLTLPQTNIDSYVLKEPKAGEFFYERKDIYKNDAFSGSYVTPHPFDENTDDAHRMIFGHYMYGYFGEWMFTKLHEYFADAEAAKKHEYIYLYFPDHSERWKVITAMDATADDTIYESPFVLGSDEYENMIRHVLENSRFQLEDPMGLSKNEMTLMLSTCALWGDGVWGRFAVFARPDVRYDYATEQVSPLRFEASADGLKINTAKTEPEEE